MAEEKLVGETSSKGELASLISALQEDGVERGKREADEIVAHAKKESARIVDDTRTQADGILKDARKKADETYKRLESQLELALRDFLLKAKTQLEELIALKPLRGKVDEAMGDPDFVKKLIYDMLYGYTKSEAARETRHLHITIPEKMKDAFVKEWLAMMRKELNMVATLHAEEDLIGFKFSAEGSGGMLVVDSDSIIDSLKPFVSERFQYILDKEKLPKN